MWEERVFTGSARPRLKERGSRNHKFLGSLHTPIPIGYTKLSTITLRSNMSPKRNGNGTILSFFWDPLRKRGTSRLPVSVRLSVTSMCYRIETFSGPDSRFILVF